MALLARTSSSWYVTSLYQRIPLAYSVSCSHLQLNHTLFLQAPNFVGVPLGLAQMILFCVYRAKRSQRVENEKVHGGKQLDFIKERSDVEKPKFPLDDQDIEMQLNV